MRPTLVLFLTLGTLAFSTDLHAEALRAGVAKTDITPSGNELQWGYESRKTPATGTLDPLVCARTRSRSGENPPGAGDGRSWQELRPSFVAAVARLGSRFERDFVFACRGLPYT